MRQDRRRFSKEEYLERQLKVRNSMEKSNIDALIVYDPANMFWLTGYDGWSFYVHQCVIITTTGDLFWYGRGIDAKGAELTTDLELNNILSYPDEYVMTPDRHPMEFLANILKEKGLHTKKIGLEKDNYFFSARAAESLYSSLPSATFSDQTGLVNWQRAVKSDTEIGFMKSAAQISERGMKTAMEVINPGVRQCDAVGEIQKTLFYGTEEFGGEYSSIATLLPTGKGTSASHLTASQDKFVEGEATIIELSGVYKRYHAPMARTLLLGKPDQLKIDTMNKTIEALEAGISLIKPGNTADDVAQAFWKILDKYGIDKKSRTGYSIGIGYPPDWGEHTLNIYKGDMTVLEPNVCFHMIAVMQFGDWGVEASEAIRVTENGSELFCNFPKDLYIKE